MVTRDRAISTVMDVCLALLIISASVMLVGMYLHDDEESIEGDRGDQALETLSGSTVTITYNLDAPNESGHAATDSDNYDLPDNLEPENVGELYNITTYGSAADLLGEAALSNLRIDGTELFAYGHEVERSVEAAIQGRLVGSEGNVYAVATWEPYEGAGINGTATAGSRPPSTADVSSATMEVSTDIPALDPRSLANSLLQNPASRPDAEDGFDFVGRDIAAAMVEGYFPATQSQYTLESTLSENPATLYNYRQMADVAGVDIESELTGTLPDATEANEKLRGDPGADGLAPIIADDLRNSTAGEKLEAAIDDFGNNPTPAERDELEALCEELFEPETIEITVQTWD
ncbi:DUF7284 family protein [Halopiger goleimassiliensis]|uniref:DUF7284 family protein n=1 Tax=Halopiger goleimassiliensis TaxID=1293048 RepID=UPI0012B5CE9B|nr:hypothetical protein [Halopiger goleimassiliensis]